MRSILTYLFLVFVLLSKSQNTVLARVSPGKNSTLEIKWYSPKIVSAEGFNIYRKEFNGIAWEKLNSKPLTFKSFTVPEEEIKKDKELKNYMEIAADPSNIKDLALLAVLIKSFKSDAFSKYLGIRFDDNTVEQNKEYEYKITSITNGSESELGLSKKITYGKYTPVDPPKNITCKTGNKKVSFKWQPEPDAYFGVNIYRKTGDTGQLIKITKDPVILSKIKNSMGEEVYGEEFFVDGKLKPRVPYYYQFEALDFFGSPSLPSKSLLIVLKDLDPPKSPDSIYNSLDGKKVTVKWKKKIKEEDLLGYHVYHTTKNDTDFTRINKEIVSFRDSFYVDHVANFGSYMYAVSCVDKDSNETVSNPFHIRVYDNEPPLKPGNLTIQADSGKLVLKWNKNTEEDLKGYFIYRTINKNSEDTYVKITPDPLTENSYTDLLPKNIKNNFLYKVVAIDLSLNRSPYSEYAIARMPDIIPPNAPFVKTIYSNEKKQVLIEWLPNAEPDLAGYHIYRKDLHDSSASFKKLNVKIIDRTSFRYTDRYAEQGVLYEYYLEALDSSGNLSKSSNRTKFKLRVEGEENKIKIAHFEADYNSKRQQVQLKWSLKNEATLKGSVVYKLKAGETSFSPISGNLEEESLLDKDISAGGNYTYQLRVYDQRGDVYRSEKITLTIK